MNNSRVIKIVVVVLAFVGAVGFLGFYFLKTEDPALLSVEAVAASPAGQEIFQALAELRGLSMDDGVFKLHAFETLQDYSININPEPIQRPNPYAPIGFEQPAPAATPASTTPRRQPPVE
jgi:hypothetical protein